MGATSKGEAALAVSPLIRRRGITVVSLRQTIESLPKGILGFPTLAKKENTRRQTHHIDRTKECSVQQEVIVVRKTQNRVVGSEANIENT